MSYDPSQYDFTLAQLLADLTISKKRNFKSASWDAVGSATSDVKKAMSDDNLDISAANIEFHEIDFNEGKSAQKVLLVDVTNGPNDPAPDTYRSIYVVVNGSYIGRSNAVAD